MNQNQLAQLTQVDLTGGYYDAGDNVKYGLPMAFTITTLAWGAIFYRWGTDYFLKCSTKRNHLYVQTINVGLGQKTCRHLGHCTRSVEQQPGTEIAAETSAALAPAAIVF
ncbi:Endoglucanase 16-like protein [Drosera capensis]